MNARPQVQRAEVDYCQHTSMDQGSKATTFAKVTTATMHAHQSTVLLVLSGLPY